MNSQDKSDVQKKLLLTLNHQVEQLTQFTITLSEFYAGVSPELDNELSKLCGHLKDKENFSLVDVRLRNAKRLIKQKADEINHKNSKAISTIKSSMKNLQHSELVEEGLEKKIVKLLSSLPDRSPSLYESADLYNKALFFYESTIENFRTNDVSASTTVKPAHSLTISEELADKENVRIRDELKVFINQLLVMTPKNDQLKVLFEQLNDECSHAELFEISQIIMLVFSQSFSRDKKQAERFISKLHTELNTASESVVYNMEEQAELSEIKETQNQLLKEHIASLGQEVEGSNDLQSLKEQANFYMASISSTLDDREKIDADDKLNLIGLLTEMKLQLTNMHEQTAKYKEKLAHQKRLSARDALTKQPNRLAYTERVELEFARWQRHGGELAMAIIDVDHFKKINDTYGHAAGDKTLQVLAGSISSNLRRTDFLARWGGEEFVLLLPQTKINDLLIPLDSIRERIEKIPFSFKDKQVTITVSIGSAYFEENDTVEEVFERADAALYEAKESGRNKSIIKARRNE